jgi:hypothetical protein
MQGITNELPWPQDHTMEVLAVGASVGAALGAWLYMAHADRRRRRGLPYPPGPPRRPLIGNLLDMPSADECVVYRDWARKYGA